MKKTNVLVEVSDEIYDTVIEPMKKNKTFSKLIASLLEGYLTDGYIQAFADDTLADLRRAAVDSFSASVDSMSESLSNMGLFTNELEQTSLSGRTKFKSIADTQAKELDKQPNTPNTVSMEEIDKKLNDFESSLNSRIDRVLEVVTKIFENGVPSPVTQVATVVPTEVPSVVSVETSHIEDVKKPVENVESFTSGVAENPIVESYDDDLDEETKEANDFMASMLVGNFFEG
jgi:hypothetical protein